MLIKSGEEWTFDKIEEAYGHIERIAHEKFGLTTFPDQIEIINYEQMLDAYSAVGMPIFYTHWSFGKQFVRQLEHYRRGYMGLAYEIVINSNPCISYLMEENTMLMQTLVMAHACMGHNHFFKNNYLFKQWTDPDGIIDYLVFAKRFIMEQEEIHGREAVEEILDACHALQMHGVDKYKRPATLSAKAEEELRKEREKYLQSQLNDLWRRTIPEKEKATATDEERFPQEPQENLLYFIEKNAPNLDQWKREIIRIVRKISQYFYPQMQTKVMNEGCATYFHYKIIHEMQKEGLIHEGAMFEFYETHTNVTLQRGFDERGGGGINPYALGFAMYNDIERVATNPTEEDREWFRGQKWVGDGDYLKTIRWAVENFKDESFIQQFLSPKVIRDFKLFVLHDDDKDPMLEITDIHNRQGYANVRSALARQYNIGYAIPDIQVYDVDRWGDRSMTLHHHMVNRRPLHNETATTTLHHLATLWGYDVKLESQDVEGCVRAIYSIKGGETLLDIFLDDDN
jgi:stage V sporulation protein R